MNDKVDDFDDDRSLDCYTKVVAVILTRSIIKHSRPSFVPGMFK